MISRGTMNGSISICFNHFQSLSTFSDTCNVSPTWGCKSESSIQNVWFRASSLTQPILSP